MHSATEIFHMVSVTNLSDTYKQTHTDTYPFCGNSILIAPGTLVAMVAVEGKVPLGTRLGIPGNMNWIGCAVE